MGKKSKLVTTLALMAVVLVCFSSYLAVHPQKTKMRAQHIATVNRVYSVSITLTNNATLNHLPIAKP